MSGLDIAFDLDGLLLDSEPLFLEAARRLLACRGKQLDLDFMHAIMGMPGRDVLPRFQLHFELTDTVEAIGLDYRKYFIEAMEGNLVPLRLGARALIERLRSSAARLAIATSSHRAYVEQVFAPHGLLDHFHHLFTAEDVQNGKPAPDVYLLAAMKLNVSINELIVLEDSPNGVTAAKAAGAFCIAVPQAHTPRQAVSAADVIAESLEDVAVWQRLGLEMNTPTG